MSNSSKEPKYETPRLASFELVDARALAAEFVRDVVVCKSPDQAAVLTAQLADWLQQDRNRLVDAFAKLVRKVNPSFHRVPPEATPPCCMDAIPTDRTVGQSWNCREGHRWTQQTPTLAVLTFVPTCPTCHSPDVTHSPSNAVSWTCHACGAVFSARKATK